MSKFNSLLVILIVCVVSTFGQYEVPDALIEVFSPKGFKISIADEEGIKLFAIHAKLNEEMNGREGGTYSRDIIKSKDGRWTFIDRSAKLRVGDILYYWTYVDYFDGERKLGYIKDDQMFTVTELIPDLTISTTQRTTTIRTTTPQPKKTTPVNPNCLSTVSRVGGKNKVCGGKILFQENFGNNFGKKWQTEIKFSGEPDYEFVLYTDDKDNMWIQKNILFIKPTITDEKLGVGFVYLRQGLDLGVNCTGVPGTLECAQKPQAYIIMPPVLSARINTKLSFSFVYGKIEIRAKLPKGDWIYPELFLNPKHNEYGVGYESGQIRLAFLPGNYQMNRKLSGGCILGSSVAARNYAIRSIDKEKSWTEDFHIFSVLWEPSSITLSVDGEIYGTIFPATGGFATEESLLKLTAAERWKSGTVFAPFDKEMYLTIGVGVGGHSFPDSETKPWINFDPKFQRKFYMAKDTWYPTWGQDSALQVDYITVTAL